MNKKTIIIIAVVVVVLAAGGYFYWKKNQSNVTGITTNVDEPVIKEATIEKPVFPIEKGSKGKEVEQLQIFLLKAYGAQLPNYGRDGQAGDETIAAMKKFMGTDKVSKEEFLKKGMNSIKSVKYK